MRFETCADSSDPFPQEVNEAIIIKVTSNLPINNRKPLPPSPAKIAEWLATLLCRRLPDGLPESTRGRRFEPHL